MNVYKAVTWSCNKIELENVVHSSVQDVNVLYWICQARTFNACDVHKLCECLIYFFIRIPTGSFAVKFVEVWEL